MTSVKFLTDSKGIQGFTISGHSSKASDDELGKIVCAAVSSAAYMAANTITEIIGDRVKAEVDDGYMYVKVLGPCDMSYKVLEGLKLHLEELSEEYSETIKIYGGAENVKD